MSSHVVVYVNGLVRPVPLSPVHAEVENARSDAAGPSGSVAEAEEENRRIDISDGEADEEPLIGFAECRICREECSIKNLESPCACSGSLKYAHRKCIQHWCNEKGNIICEICHQPYQPGYSAPPPPLHTEETTVNIGGGWTISGLDLHNHRLLAIAEAEHLFLDSECDDYTAPNASGAAFFRSVALILMALLLLRHALTITDDPDGEDDSSSIFSLFLLRAAGFLLPCYIMARAIIILQRRRQRQDLEVLATQFALVMRSGQGRAVHFRIGPGPAPPSMATANAATTSTSQHQHEEEPV
ncbi:PREDICTED: uncharacterized protein LOC104824079 [Tarenaya hassleriana]|uniref:uncharacterized protein LOC104824079 n=1 Tax=Tarenaya hassleriana TaxID=28532 RepID=UPI00053C18EF|nr:PREDICTED: uncharacterized protein LOC104824079 [Tarenaya hassleriana]XP_010554313.1 PREDICTED: uncharacterized protein LOC104824079 [Tarenaya hassleriana]